MLGIQNQLFEGLPPGNELNMLALPEVASTTENSPWVKGMSP
jgi:hypothetical protein